MGAVFKVSKTQDTYSEKRPITFILKVRWEFENTSKRMYLLAMAPGDQSRGRGVEECSCFPEPVSRNHTVCGEFKQCGLQMTPSPAPSGAKEQQLPKLPHSLWGG